MSMEADLSAKFAIELAKSEALRRVVANTHVSKDAARMIWSLGWAAGQEAGLARAVGIMGGTPK